MKDPNVYPPGWGTERVRKVIEYHDRLLQDEDAMIAAIEEIDSDPNLTWVPVPRNLVSAVLDLIEGNAK